MSKAAYALYREKPTSSYFEMLVPVSTWYRSGHFFLLNTENTNHAVSRLATKRIKLERYYFTKTSQFL